MITEPDATAWLFALEPLCVLDPPLQLDQFDAAILPGGVSIAACPAFAESFFCDMSFSIDP